MNALLEEVNARIDTPFRGLYGNYIGGAWIPPIHGHYFDNLSPIDGQFLCRIPQSDSAE